MSEAELLRNKNKLHVSSFGASDFSTRKKKARKKFALAETRLSLR